MRTEGGRSGVERRIKERSRGAKERKEWWVWRARLGLRGHISEEAERDTGVQLQGCLLHRSVCTRKKAEMEVTVSSGAYTPVCVHVCVLVRGGTVYLPCH